MVKQSTPTMLKSTLDSAIFNITENKNKYVKKPGIDFTRERKLSMTSVIRLLLTMGSKSLNKELFEFAEATDINVTSSAFIQQRKKIKPEAFRDLLCDFDRATQKIKTFYGYRVLAADGSAISMARNPDAESFIWPSNQPHGYNQYQLNALYDLLTRTYFDAELQPASKMDERAALINMLRRNNFNDKTIIIADRGYESYNMFANFIETNGVFFVCRVKDGGNGAMKEIINLPMWELDQDIAVEITTSQTKDDKLHNRRFIPTGSKKGKPNSPKTKIRRWDFHSPYSLKIRVVRFMLENGNYETIVTSLPRNEFSSTDIKDLYHMRWGIETSFRELKYFVGLIALHGKSDEFVEQEIYSALIAYNFCERITGEVVVKNVSKNIHVYQVNYSMAFFLCREYYKRNKTNGEKLLEDIGKYIQPVRPGRKDKRKMRTKTFIGFLYRIAA